MNCSPGSIDSYGLPAIRFTVSVGETLATLMPRPMSWRGASSGSYKDCAQEHSTAGHKTNKGKRKGTAYPSPSEAEGEAEGDSIPIPEKLLPQVSFRRISFPSESFQPAANHESDTVELGG